MSDLKHKIIEDIIAREGGYSNDPSDSGGPTRYGITKRVARANGYHGPMQELPRDLAVRVYSAQYWDRMNLSYVESVSPKIAEEIADTSVNMGTVRAGKFLQTALNALNSGADYYPDLSVDGQIGSKTVSALVAYHDVRGEDGIDVLHSMLNCQQGYYYIKLSIAREKDEKYIYGWFRNRVL